MQFFGSTLLFSAAAASLLLASSPARAQTVFVADSHIHHCDPSHQDRDPGHQDRDQGHQDRDPDRDDDNLVCHDRQAFSLSAFQNGLIHLPVEGHEHRRFVLVNDTGAPVKLLQCAYIGTLDADAHLRCHVNGTVHKILQACDISGWTPVPDGQDGKDRDAAHADGKQRHDEPGGAVPASPEFSFFAGAQQTGIPTGAYFDLRTDGFRAREGDMGYLTGMGLPTVSSNCTAVAVAATATGAASAYRQAPPICWPDPAAIVYGTPLSPVQLDATAGTAGSFVYSPAAGAVLPPGVQTLSATFTPANTTNFATVVANAKLTVHQASQTVLTAVRNPDPNNPVLLTITVTTQPGGQPATGSVTILDTTSWVQAAVQLTNGQATWLVPATLTSLTVYGVYPGNGDVAGSTSAPMSGPQEIAILYPTP